MNLDFMMSEEDEHDILRQLFGNDNAPMLVQIKRYLEAHRRKGSSISLFNRNTCLYMIAKILERGASMSEEPRDIHGADFIKYYLAIEDELSRVDDASISTAIQLKGDEPYYFQQYMWPMLLKTYWLIQPKDSLLEILKLAYVVNYILTYEKSKDGITERPYAEVTQSYLISMGVSSVAEFSLRLVDIIGHLYQIPPAGQPLIKPTQRIQAFLDCWARPASDIGTVAKKTDLEAVYQKPLIKLENGNYLILDRSILSGGIYNSMLRHFQSCKEVAFHFPKFIDLKNLISDDVIDRIIFRLLIKYIFDGDHDNVHFPMNKDEALPDAVVQSHGDEYFFEMKDYSMPYDVIRRRDYSLVQADIQKKMIKDLSASRPRGGAAQLVRYISEATKSRRVKLSRTYPVLIYSDSMYSMHGVSSMVSNEYQKLWTAEGKMETRPITMISLGALFATAHTLKNGGFGTALRAYAAYNKKRRKSKAFRVGLDGIIADHAPIERISMEPTTRAYKSDRKFLEQMLAKLIASQ